MRTRDPLTWLGDPPSHSRPKLTPAQRGEIRRRYAEGETAAALASEYDVSAGLIRSFTDSRGHW